jgi:lipid A ethanolaminephosphotransferase
MNTHSFMMKTERVQIDRMIPIDDVPVYLRDQTIAARVLPDLLGAKERQFIYVNKKGIHRPYHEKYPQDFGGPGGVLPTAVSLADLGSRDALLKTYQRAVQWSVDEFFRTLLAHIDLSDTVILYTSDHGQSLLEGGYKLSHCSVGNVIPERQSCQFLLSPATDRSGNACRSRHSNT